MSDIRDRILNAPVPEPAESPAVAPQLASALEAVESAILALQRAREALLGEAPKPKEDELGNCLHPASDLHEITTFGNETTIYCNRCGEVLP